MSLPFVRWLLQRRSGARLWAMLIARSIRKTRAGNPGGEGRLRLLVFSPHRAVQDCDIIERTGRAVVFPLNFYFLSRIDGLFRVRDGKLIDWEDYLTSSDPFIARSRERHIAFAASVLHGLQKRLGVHAAFSPAAHYRHEAIWSRACERIGLAFVCVHKEMTIVNDRHVANKIESKKWRRVPWNGAFVCVSNEAARRIAVGAGLVPSNRIAVSGLLRSDDLVGPYARPPRQPEPKSITLFSFGHLTGAFLTIGPTRSHYFSKDDQQGFVRLFNAVHAAAADFACRNKDCIVYIKPKLFDPWWIGEMEAAIHAELGICARDIPNLRIVNEPALELIDRSRAVIAMNSTVVLEARLRGRPVIMPLFDEAAGVHKDAMYFEEFLDLFAVASSRDAMLALMHEAVAGRLEPAGEPGRVGEALRRYFGHDDGRCADRALDTIEALAARSASQSVALAASAAPSVEGSRV
jgi:hypothetical protein